MGCGPSAPAATGQNQVKPLEVHDRSDGTALLVIAAPVGVSANESEKGLADGERERRELEKSTSAARLVREEAARARDAEADLASSEWRGVAVPLWQPSALQRWLREELEAEDGLLEILEGLDGESFSAQRHSLPASPFIASM